MQELAGVVSIPKLVLTSQARSERGRIRAPCSRPIVCGLCGEIPLVSCLPEVAAFRVMSLTRELLLHVLVVLVAEAVGADQGSGFGITCDRMG